MDEKNVEEWKQQPQKKQLEMQRARQKRSILMQMLIESLRQSWQESARSFQSSKRQNSRRATLKEENEN